MKLWLIYPLAASAVTALLHGIGGVAIGYSALIAFIGWPIIGTMVTADDDLPGGFSNPDGTATPDWETAEYWGKLCGGCAVVCVAFLLQLGWAPPWPFYFIPAAVISALTSFLLLRRALRSGQHAG